MTTNGCGPAWLKKWRITRWVQAALFNWFFEASCDRHDEGYNQGGDEVRRFECDWRFYQAMRRDTLRQRGIARLIRWLQALLFFALVRAFGWRHFNYRTERQQWEQ